MQECSDRFFSLLESPPPPKNAILGTGKIMKQPVVVGEEITGRSIMYLCLSYDHRVIHGEVEVKVLQEVKKALESPERIFKRLDYE
ncbi:MAG: 2-oxo acid dehydrogenase subunit E2 [Deltaproteobacteria bacterium]|nr:2-oxo acid dehydrogenase subunit E2 [Deltaproteobacteria bacterium]